MEVLAGIIGAVIGASPLSSSPVSNPNACDGLSSLTSYINGGIRVRCMMLESALTPSSVKNSHLKRLTATSTCVRAF
jgi:hypothetical protein